MSILWKRLGYLFKHENTEYADTYLVEKEFGTSFSWTAI